MGNSEYENLRGAEHLFESILFDHDTQNLSSSGPSSFVDLNLDQIIDAITSGKKTQPWEAESSTKS